MPPNFRRLPLGEMKVGSACIDEDFEELVDVGHDFLEFESGVGAGLPESRMAGENGG